MYSREHRQVAKDGAVKGQFVAKARAGHIGQLQHQDVEKCKASSDSSWPRLTSRKAVY